ncbi:MAG: DMT family transporter, partial [Actinomycetota bacterium]|nr:DMT family transporter [Actinomycetota bacterium]
AVDSPSGGGDAWLGFAYVSLVSMFLGFFAWYRGLPVGGVAKIGQLQLAQPVLTLVWSALLLGETISPTMIIAALAVLASVAIIQRTRVRSLPGRPLARPLGAPEIATTTVPDTRR